MHLRIPCPILALALTLSAVTARADTSATLPTAINLPRGPASLEGFGQGYDLSPASGLPSLSYALEVPPGRAGLVPELALHYNAGEGAGALGLGWSLGLPAIERSLRRGIPDYGDTPTWTLKGLGGGEELIETEPGILRERLEQGAPVFVRELPGGAMSAITTDGTGYLFGLTADARLVSGGDIFRLELSAITDVHGNRVDFFYTRIADSDAPLLTAITWNDGHAAVRLTYEARPDLVRTRAPGFPVTLGHRLDRIKTEVDGKTVRTTSLTYTRDVFTPSSVLARIETVAPDGAALPTWHLTYTARPDAPMLTTLPNAPALDPTVDGRAWVDIDGDALPDLLDATPGAWRFRKGLGTDLSAAWTNIPAPAVSISKSTRFADLTGDGIQDILAQPGEGDLWAYTSGDTPFAAAAQVPLDLSFDLTAQNVALVDLNLDGRVDILRHDEPDAWTWLRNYDNPGYTAADAVPPPPPGLRLGDPGVQLADIDGDRLPDLARIMPTDSRVLVATHEGLGIFAEPADMAGVPEMTEHDRWELADITGDGAADLLRIGHKSADLWVNQHDNSFAAAASISWPDLGADELVILNDVDASGTIDLLRVDPQSTKPWRMWSFAERPGLLATLRTDLGYARAFTYRSAAALAVEDAALGTAWSTTPPTPTAVLVQSDESDAHSPWTSTTRHRVRDGWYDPARGEFRGFAEQRDEHPGDAWTEPSTLTRSYDLGQQDEARKLQLLASETRSLRGVLTRELHTLEIESPTSGVQAIRRTATDVFHIEAGPETAAARVRTEWDHDLFNNVLEERALGRVDRKTGADIPGDERITTKIYAEPTSPDAPRDRLAEQIVADADGVQLTATRTYYDGDPEVGLPLGQLGSRGLISRNETWIADDQWAPTLRQTHDARGNVVRVRDAEGGIMTRQFDALGLFPIEERVAIDDGALVTAATWDPRSGQPTAVTAPSGATSSFTFDGLGRLTAEVLPGDTLDLPTRRHSYHFAPGTRPSVVTELRRVSGEPDVERTVQHLDGLGRPMARITHDDTGEAAILAEANIYSANGQIAEQIEGQALTAAALEPGATVTPAANWPRTRSEHDALGRLVFERDPDGREHQTTHGPLWTEAREHEDLHPVPPYTDAPKRSIVDGLGRLVRVEHTLAGRNILHNYTHDGAGRLLAHTDPAGHLSRYTRDGAGHLIAVDNPDAGRITQRFDLAGRIIERSNATGARITWSYDGAGRLLEQRSFDPAGTKISAATLHYDHAEDPAAKFERGQLTAVDDDAGHASFTHDARGRVVHMSRLFAAQDGPLTLSTTTEYDAQDRVIRETYPDGSPLEREYTARGLERPLAGWTTAAAWDARGRWTSLAITPDLTLTRALDYTGRLQTQQVRRGDAKLLDLAHTYDVAGLLAETRDLAGPTPQTPALAQRFAHDDLHRLTHAAGPYGEQSFTYSDDENLLTLVGVPLTYDGPQPHAVAYARGQQFTYDAAGQLARVTGEGPVSAGAWQFDPHGRLQTFTTEDGRRTEHIYDHAGKETIRREYDAAAKLAHETLYFTPAAEVRDGQLVRWVFWAGERIAESPTDIPRGDASLPAAAMITGLLLLLLLRYLHVALARLRQTLGIFASPLRHAPTFAVLALAALSCGDDRTGNLRPDAQTRYHIADRLGSAALVLDHDGEVIARDLHDPYGTSAIAWRGEQQPGPTYRFTGKEDHTLASAVSIGARQYLPALGRWASPDPQFLLDPEAQLGRPGERNLYVYAGNGPVQHIDPTGYGWISMAVKLVKAGAKAVYKGYDKVDEFSGIVDDAATVVSSQAGIGSRVLSALSLASEALPISAGDLKDGYRWVRGGDRVLDAAADARASQRSAWETARELSSGSTPGSRTSTLRPGPYAGESIPARSPGRNFTAEEHAQGNALGQTQGCHTCGARSPGTKSGNYVLDHQPPSALNPSGGEQRLHPQCLNCSQRQGGQVRVAKARGNGSPTQE